MWQNLINRMDYVHFDVLNFECRGTNNSDSHFTGLVPRNELSPPQNLKTFRNAEKRTT